MARRYEQALARPEADGGSRYAFGDQAMTGYSPFQNPNPELKWEETAATNIALDYGFMNNRFTGSLEYYVKNTDDLLLRVDVPQPAVAPDRFENIGKIKNTGFEVGGIVGQLFSPFAVIRMRLMPSTSFTEIAHFLTPVSAVAKIAEGDIVELVSGPFRGEKAKVTRVDDTKEEITVELIESMVPIPITVKGEHVRVLEKGSA